MTTELLRVKVVARRQIMCLIQSSSQGVVACLQRLEKERIESPPSTLRCHMALLLQCPACFISIPDVADVYTRSEQENSLLVHLVHKFYSS